MPYSSTHFAFLTLYLVHLFTHYIPPHSFGIYHYLIFCLPYFYCLSSYLYILQVSIELVDTESVWISSISSLPLSSLIFYFPTISILQLVYFPSCSSSVYLPLPLATLLFAPTKKHKQFCDEIPKNMCTS
jgi:hypothetical protein